MINQAMSKVGKGKPVGKAEAVSKGEAVDEGEAIGGVYYQALLMGMVGYQNVEGLQGLLSLMFVSLQLMKFYIENETWYNEI